MGSNKTHFLTDDPAQTDEFGTHARIATLIKSEILDSTEGRSIAVVGDWGSGKSTIITLLQNQLKEQTETRTHFFVYDAWAHQGDQLRRAFLDDFIASLFDDQRINKSEKDDLVDRIWNRVETTTTTVEPVLRPHAKWLFFTLALIPFGFKFFDIPAGKDFWTELFTGRNLLGSLFLLALPLSTIILALIKRYEDDWLKDRIFGDSHKQPGFSVLSFFFEKTSGKAERKRIKSPADSIAEFRDAFLDTIAKAASQEASLRVVIVIDNIDRIPVEEARDFWSTMQTFFGDGGGRRNGDGSKKYWLVAPFSERALEFVFPDEQHQADDDRRKAKAYIDKAFGVAFYVPPPILADWRRYLLEKLEKAFPEHDSMERIGARDLYDNAVRAGERRTTPRDMKLFVNRLVVSYRQRGDELGLPVLAAYLIHKDKIGQDNIVKEDLLSPENQLILGSTDWRSMMGALHFDVSPAQAEQLILQEPIVSALRERASDKLVELSSKPGFVDVLPRVLLAELGTAALTDGGQLATLASCVASIPQHNDPVLTLPWRTLRLGLEKATSWSNFEIAVSEGVEVAIAHSPTDTHSNLRQSVLSSMSGSVVDEANKNPNSIATMAENWLALASASIGAMRKANAETSVAIPGSPAFNLAVIQGLAADARNADLAKSVKCSNARGTLQAFILERISNGGVISYPTEVVSYLRDFANPSIQWPEVAAAIAERLRAPVSIPVEFEDQLLLLFAITHLADEPSGLARLKELSVQGTLAHYFGVMGEASTRSAILTATLISNSAYERSGEFQQSSDGDAKYRELMGQEQPEAQLLDATCALFKEFDLRDRAFEIAVTQKQNFTAALLASLVLDEEDTASFKIDGDRLLAVSKYLYAQRAKMPVNRLLLRMHEPANVIGSIASKAFDLNMSFIYEGILQIPQVTPLEAFAEYVSNGLTALDAAKWNRAITQPANARDNALALAQALKAVELSFGLGVAMSDSIRSIVRDVGAAKTASSNELSESIKRAMSLLLPELKEPLLQNILDDLDDQPGSHISLVLQLLRSDIHLNPSTDYNRIARRVFARILAEPSIIAVNWMNAEIMSGDFKKSLSLGTLADLRMRLEEGIQKEGASSDIVEAIGKTQVLLALDQHESAETPES